MCLIKQKLSQADRIIRVEVMVDPSVHSIDDSFRLNYIVTGIKFLEFTETVMYYKNIEIISVRRRNKWIL